MGNIHIQENTISSINLDGNINLSPNGLGTINLNTDVLIQGNLLPNSNVAYNLGSSTQRFKDIYLSGTTIKLGDSQISANATALIFTNQQGGNYVIDTAYSANTATIVNGNSNVLVTANSNVAVSVNGNANVLVVTSTGANISGTLNATGNLVTANANLGNLATANFVNVANDLSVSGNASITGNLKVLGTVSYINTTTTYITDPLTEVGGGPNGAALLSNDNKDRGTLLHYYTDKAVDAFIGWDNSNAEFALAANVTSVDNVITYNEFGNVRVGNLTSANANLGNLATANFLSTTKLTTSAIVSGNLTITSVTNDTVIDSFTTSTYRTAKYIIKASSNAGYESLEVLLIHDGSNSFITIYGAISTIDDDIITLTSNIASGNVKLYATGSSANTVVNLVGTYVTD